MLKINPETVCLIIEKARQFQAKEQVVIPTVPDYPGDIWALQVLADHTGDHCYQKVVLAITGLEPDQKIELVALMRLGRGDYVLGEWETALLDADDILPESTAAYLLAHPLVTSYLMEGLAQHGYRCEE